MQKVSESKDQMCGYFSTFPYHQVSGFQMLPKTDCDVIAQAVLLADCPGEAVDCGADSGVLTAERTYMENPFSDGARYSAQWFSLGEPSTHVWKTLHRQRGKHSAQWIQGAKVTAHVSRHKLKH